MADNIFGVGESPAPWLEPEEPITTSETDVEAEGTPAEAAPEAEPEQAPDETPEFGEETPAVAEATDEEFVEEQTPEEAAAEAGVPLEDWLASQPEHLWANKYKSVQALEDGYRERSRMWNDAVNRAKAEEAQRISEYQQRMELEQGLRQVIPILEQAAQREQLLHQTAAEYQRITGQFPPGYVPPDPNAQRGPVAGPQDVERMVEARLQQAQQEWAMQQQQAMELQSLEAAIAGFYQDHPEVEPRGALDNEITDALLQLNESPSWQAMPNPDGTLGREVDPSDRGSLEVLYELAQRPTLLEVLKLHPEYFDSEVGLQLARREAARLDGVPDDTQPTSTVVPASQARSGPGPKVPFAESAQGTLPQNTGPNMDDPWERVKASDSSGPKRSVFSE
jgi:hypothetical protein